MKTAPECPIVKWRGLDLLGEDKLGEYIERGLVEVSRSIRREIGAGREGGEVRCRPRSGLQVTE